jgi:hypothetical protein
MGQFYEMVKMMSKKQATGNAENKLHYYEPLPFSVISWFDRLDSHMNQDFIKIF